MRFRWTIEELNTKSDAEFLIGVLNERESDCTNYYSPLAKRIKATRGRLEKQLQSYNTALTAILDREELRHLLIGIHPEVDKLLEPLLKGT